MYAEKGQKKKKKVKFDYIDFFMIFLRIFF